MCKLGQHYFVWNTNDGIPVPPHCKCGRYSWEEINAKEHKWIAASIGKEETVFAIEERRTDDVLSN